MQRGPPSPEQFQMMLNKDNLAFDTPISVIEQYHLDKLSVVLDNYSKTPLGAYVFKSQGASPAEINSLDDFFKIVPYTNRDIVEQRGDYLLTPDANIPELIEAHSSGSTRKPVVILHHRQGVFGMKVMALLDRSYGVFGGKPSDNITFDFSRTSSVWNTKVPAEMYFGSGFSFIDPQPLLNADPNINSINDLSGEALHNARVLSKTNFWLTYSGLALNELTRFKPIVVEELLENLVVLMQLGDVGSPSEAKFIYDHSSAKAVVNPWTSIEQPFATMYCPKMHHHFVIDSYLPELTSEGELVLTDLSPFKGYHMPRYPTGDVFESVDCDCGWSWPAANFVRRLNNDPHKNLKTPWIKEVISGSDSLKNRLVAYDVGAIKEGMMTHIYIQQGPNYSSADSSMINAEIVEGLMGYEPVQILAKQSKSWDLKVHVVPELPSSVRGELGKFKSVDLKAKPVNSAGYAYAQNFLKLTEGLSVKDFLTTL